MADDDDILEFRGVVRKPARDQSASSAAPARRRFLSVWFRCCHTYGRMTCNKAQTAYEGRCPKCGAKVRAVVGEGGTNRRMFVAE